MMVRFLMRNQAFSILFLSLNERILSISIAFGSPKKLTEITPKAMELTPEVWEIEVVSKRTLNLNIYA